MCRFITAILPKAADIAEASAVFREHGRACHVYVSASLAAQIGNAESICHTTAGHCDCGTPLGSTATGAASDDRGTREIEVARLRRKGWSESKIARMLVQRDEAGARPRAPGQGQTSLGEWCALIHAVLASPRITYVGLLIHEYRGDINDEEVALQGRQTVRAKDLDEATLASMRDDTIYEFRR
ncbi:MAG: hypothetical protein ABL934_10160 [Lysobacteraceae bacterium]